MYRDIPLTLKSTGVTKIYQGNNFNFVEFNNKTIYYLPSGVKLRVNANGCTLIGHDNKYKNVKFNVFRSFLTEDSFKTSYEAVLRILHKNKILKYRKQSILNDFLIKDYKFLLKGFTGNDFKDSLNLLLSKLSPKIDHRNLLSFEQFKDFFPDYKPQPTLNSPYGIDTPEFNHIGISHFFKRKGTLGTGFVRFNDGSVYFLPAGINLINNSNGIKLRMNKDDDNISIGIDSQTEFINGFKMYLDILKQKHNNKIRPATKIKTFKLNNFKRLEEGFDTFKEMIDYLNAQVSIKDLFTEEQIENMLSIDGENK